MGRFWPKTETQTDKSVSQQFKPKPKSKSTVRFLGFPNSGSVSNSLTFEPLLYKEETGTAFGLLSDVGHFFKKSKIIVLNKIRTGDLQHNCQGS